MTAPLDEKALADAHDAFYATESSNSRDMMRNAIRAYLAASPSPSEMEVVVYALPVAGGEYSGFMSPETLEFLNLDPAGTEPLVTLSSAQSALSAMAAERDALRGLTPELPPFPPEGEGLPRFGLRWNGPEKPLAVPMEDGYWTPYHLASLYRRHCNAAEQELSEVSRAIGSVRWMDPPDGGDVSLGEQVNRMRADLEAAEAQALRLTEENEALRKVLVELVSAETVSVHVGYDSGAGGGNFVYADAIRTDCDEFIAARSALKENTL